MALAHRDEKVSAVTTTLLFVAATSAGFADVDDNGRALLESDVSPLPTGLPELLAVELFRLEVCLLSLERREVWQIVTINWRFTMVPTSCTVSSLNVTKMFLSRKKANVYFARSFVI